ncbi:Na+/H+ antiporter NhaC family protein [Caldanaerobacter subterraneus]|uniref:Na+/H+ antiporter NhaC family protein n=1 Tax=Caldanaerobacter subterraneus TaxID=911092 RepID=UPI0034646D46
MQNKFGFSLSIFLFTLILTMTMVLFFHKPPYIPLFISYMFTFFALLKYFSAKELLNMSLKGVKRGINVIIILLLIGALVALWKQNGTLPALIYYFSRFLKPHGFLLTSFVITSTISMILGTAVGTASTIGIVIIGLAHAFGYPLPVVAGAVISGSFIGDRTSPLAGNVALLSDMGEIQQYNVLKSLFKTAIPVFTITAFLYYLFDYHLNFSAKYDISNLFTIIVQSYRLSAILFIAPLTIIILALFRIPTKTNLAIAVSISFLSSIILGYSPLDSLKVILIGNTFYSPEFKSIFSGGGMVSILPMIGVVTFATALAGILEDTGIIKSVFQSIDKIKNFKLAYLVTMLLSTLMAVITCNQALSVILPSRIMINVYERLEIAREEMVRAIADSGMILAGIIPWNLAAMLPAAVLGVKVTEYLPYAYLNLLFPLLSIAFVFAKDANELIKFYQKFVEKGRNLLQN